MIQNLTKKVIGLLVLLCATDALAVSKDFCNRAEASIDPGYLKKCAPAIPVETLQGTVTGHFWATNGLRIDYTITDRYIRYLRADELYWRKETTQRMSLVCTERCDQPNHLWNLASPAIEELSANYQASLAATAFARAIKEDYSSLEGMMDLLELKDKIDNHDGSVVEVKDSNGNLIAVISFTIKDGKISMGYPVLIKAGENGSIIGSSPIDFLNNDSNVLDWMHSNFTFECVKSIGTVTGSDGTRTVTEMRICTMRPR